jgi:hypothetical protein
MPLSADELDEVMSLAWPLPTEVRAAFVTAVENALGGYSLGARGAGFGTSGRNQPAARLLHPASALAPTPAFQCPPLPSTPVTGAGCVLDLCALGVAA